MALIPMLAACLCASAFAAAEWTQVVKNAPWKARSDPQLVAMPDNALLLLGGHANNQYFSDVWRSEDGGNNWEVVLADGEAPAEETIQNIRNK